jgi:hypothetical protein
MKGIIVQDSSEEILIVVHLRLGPGVGERCLREGRGDLILQCFETSTPFIPRS